MKQRTAHWIFILVLAVAAFLRFYNFGDIPFMHDEFSALFRSGFHNFTDLIKYGVLPDFHPAGVQIFLNYYVMLSGWETHLLKLPFVLSGLWAILLIYRLGTEWFNPQSGIIAAALMAVSQFFIFYSQLARPYIVGLLVFLLAVRYWYRLIKAGRMQPKDYLLWIGCAALGAYIHYYLLLTLILLSLPGVFFIARRHLPLYFLSGVLIFLLYLPHLQITLAQVSRGGVESWLGKPQGGFLMDFFSYLFHYNTLYLIAFGVLLFLGLLRPPRLKPAFWLGPLLFLLAFLFGYCYSVKVNAILQFSGLIFSLPLLLLSLAYLLSRSKWLSYASLTIILSLGVYSLWHDRRHFEVFYTSPYEEFMRQTSALGTSGTEGAAVLGGEKHILDFYGNKYQTPLSSVHYLRENTDMEAIRIAIERRAQRDSASLLLGYFESDAAELFSMAQYYFGPPAETYHYYQGSLFHFRKTGKPLPISSPPLFQLDEPIIFDHQREFGAEIIIPKIFDEQPEKNWVIDIVAEVRAESRPQEVAISSSIYQNDSLLSWHSSPLETHYQRAREIFPAFHSESFHHQRTAQGQDLRIVIWNRGKSEFILENLVLRLRPHNPRQYGLYLPLAASD